jgi:hypothetical protein
MSCRLLRLAFCRPLCSGATVAAIDCIAMPKYVCHFCLPPPFPSGILPPAGWFIGLPGCPLPCGDVAIPTLSFFSFFLCLSVLCYFVFFLNCFFGFFLFFITRLETRHHTLSCSPPPPPFSLQAVASGLPDCPLPCKDVATPTRYHPPGNTSPYPPPPPRLLAGCCVWPSAAPRAAPEARWRGVV